MTYRIGIVAHHKRLQMADRLSQTVQADILSIDPGNIGANGNHKRVWAELGSYDSDWSAVLEDDAVPVADFRGQLEAVLQAAPAPIVSAYLGQKRPPQAQPLIRAAIARADHDDAHFIVGNQMFHAVAIAMHTSLIDDMLSSLRAYLPIDQAIGRWARSRGHEIAHCWPSIVNHADAPTLISHPDGKPRPPGRVAHRIGTRADWSSKSVAL